VSIMMLISFFMYRAQQRGLLAPVDATLSAPKLKDVALWCLLSAGGTLTLMSFTTYITQDISPIPLFWILPLAVYLITFILLFSNPKIYLRRTFTFAWMVLWFAELFVSRDEFGVLVAVNLALLFFMCMVFHGELVTSRPAPAYLPSFYVSM